MGFPAFESRDKPHSWYVPALQRYLYHPGSTVLSQRRSGCGAWGARGRVHRVLAGARSWRAVSAKVDRGSVTSSDSENGASRTLQGPGLMAGDGWEEASRSAGDVAVSVFPPGIQGQAQSLSEARIASPRAESCSEQWEGHRGTQPKLVQPPAA